MNESKPRRMPMSLLCCLLFAPAIGCGGEKNDGPQVTVIGAAGDEAELDWEIVSTSIRSVVGADGQMDELEVVIRAREDGTVLPSENAPPVTRPEKQIDGPKYRPFHYGGDEGKIYFDVSKVPSGPLSFELAVGHHTLFSKTKTLTVSVEVTRKTEIVQDKSGYSELRWQCTRPISCAIAIDGTSAVVTGPAGTTVTYGEESGTVEADKPLTLQLDKWSYIEGKTIAEIEALRLSVAFEMVLPDGMRFSKVVSDQFFPWSWATEALQVPGGATLPGEPPHSGKPRAMYAHGDLYGNPTRLEEIDLIGFSKDQSEYRECGTYEDKTGKNAKDHSVQKRNVTVTVYDRRTGKQRHQRKFEGDFPACPDSITAVTETMWGEYDRTKVTAWLDTLLK